MSCFRPNAMLMAQDGTPIKFLGRYTPRTADYWQGQNVVQVPCGKCSGCALDKSKEWADRMLLEYASERNHKKALFLTLTYDDDHVPGVMCTDNVYRYTLNPRNEQLFMKRLRKAFDNVSIRFYWAGEYGDLTFRPHGHAIIYGLDLFNFPDAFLYSTSGEDGNPLYESPALDQLWTHGAVRFTEATYETFCYVARYVIKKQYGEDRTKWLKGRVAPYSRQSNRPGIGSDYFDENDIGAHVFLSDGREVHDIKSPRKILEKKRLTNPEEYASIKATRRKLAENKKNLILSQTDLNYWDYLKVQETSLRDKTHNVMKRQF